jgi:hypothetical protein
MNAVFQLIKRAFRQEAALHPVDSKVAKRWIKRRLTLLFPELRNNPEALERAYQSLGLEPRPGAGNGEPETVFEMTLPEGVEPGDPDR